MSIAPRFLPVRRAFCAATLAIAVIGAAGTMAFAQQAATAEEEDDIESHILNADKRLLNAILAPFGLGSAASGPDITYRERSPLVVPTGRDLPPPGKADKSADWPVEPEVKARRAERALERSGRAPVIPDPAKPISGTAEARKTGNTGAWDDSKGAKKEPDFFSMLWQGKLGGTWEEYGKFEGEPPRTSLAQPPAGYLTPSPAAPYGTIPRETPAEKKDKKL